MTEDGQCADEMNRNLWQVCCLIVVARLSAACLERLPSDGLTPALVPAAGHLEQCDEGMRARIRQFEVGTTILP